MKTVTLDALIPREDFEIISTIGSSGNTRNKLTLSIEDLKYEEIKAVIFLLLMERID